MNGERPVSAQLQRDTAKTFRTVLIEATSAEEFIAAAVGAEPNDPSPGFFAIRFQVCRTGRRGAVAPADRYDKLWKKAQLGLVRISDAI